MTADATGTWHRVQVAHAGQPAREEQVRGHDMHEAMANAEQQWPRDRITYLGADDPVAGDQPPDDDQQQRGWVSRLWSHLFDDRDMTITTGSDKSADTTSSDNQVETAAGEVESDSTDSTDDPEPPAPVDPKTTAERAHVRAVHGAGYGLPPLGYGYGSAGQGAWDTAVAHAYTDHDDRHRDWWGTDYPAQDDEADSDEAVA